MLANKYLYRYLQIVNNAKSRTIDVLGEYHHIIPRALGGSDDKYNLVKVTFREHFILHWLLTKCTSGIEKTKINFALWMMTRNGKSSRSLTSWQYSIAKKANAKALSRKVMSAEERAKLINRNKGNKYAAGKQNAKGFKHTEEARQKMKYARSNPSVAMLEARKKQSELMKGNTFRRGKKNVSTET